MLGLLLSSSVVLLSLVGTTSAKSCSTHTFTTCPSDGIVHWYDPDDGMICDPLDCGGGRAPPRTDVPGCPAYKGTSTRATTPSYLPCWPFTTSTSTTLATPTNTAAISSTPPAVPSTSITISTSTPIGSLTPTTSPATLPTSAPSNGTQSTGNTPPPPKSTVPSAGNLVKSSLVAIVVIAGTAIGASAML